MKNLTIKLKILLIALTLLLVPSQNLITAQILDLSINKQEFKHGEKVEAKASFYNKTQEHLKGRMIVVFSPLDASAPPFSVIKEFNLAAGEKTPDLIFEMTVESWMDAKPYKAEIEIRDTRDHLISKKFVIFSILGGEKSIDADVYIYADKSCSNKRTVFGKDDRIVYFKLDTLIQDMQINATTKTPDGKIDILNFENNISSYSLKNAKEGKYSIWINLSRDGYKNRRIEKEFIFEEGYTEEVFESVCKIDGKCEGKEDKINCPKDCNIKSEIKDNENSNKIFSYAIYFIIFIVVILAAKMYINKKNSNNVIQ